MKTGIDFETGEVYVSLETNGVVTTARLKPQNARAVANAILANAQSLEQAMEDGWPQKEVLPPPAGSEE